MTRREEIITEILDRWDELVEPGVTQGVPGDGDGYPHMPSTYTPTVREIERLLKLMREERRSQWWHVTERYLRCQCVTKDVVVKRKTVKGGKTISVTERQAITTWSKAVRAEKVRRGVGWIADKWALSSEPMLPREISVAA